MSHPGTTPPQGRGKDIEYKTEDKRKHTQQKKTQKQVRLNVALTHKHTYTHSGGSCCSQGTGRSFGSGASRIGGNGRRRSGENERTALERDEENASTEDPAQTIGPWDVHRGIQRT